MELIPILSLIMLVATIATFVLAIGAYILYKIRERNGRAEAKIEQESVNAELVTPSQILSERSATKETYTGDLNITKGSYNKPLYTEVNNMKPRMRPTYTAPIYTKAEALSKRRTVFPQTVDRTTGQKKYLRYTQDGYVEPVNDENKDSILKWR